MAYKVSASASVNLLNELHPKGSGLIRYAMENSMLGIGYSEYRQQDITIGFTREINKAYMVGVRNNANVKFENLTGKTIDNPFDDFNDPAIDRTYGVANTLDLQFMPIVEIKSDKHPDGIIKTTTAKKKSEILLKAMNLKLEDVDKSLMAREDIPQVGSTAWSKYAKAYRTDSKGTHSETEFRATLKENLGEQRKAMNDITDIAIGYFGTFNEATTTMPVAMFHTFKECLEKTNSFDSEDTGTPAVGNPNDPNYVPAVPSKGIGIARRFRLHNSLYSAVYTIKGYIIRDIVGKVTESSKIGHSKVEVKLNNEEPLKIHSGLIHHTDFKDDKDVFFSNNNAWTQTKDVYVSIKVQISPTIYQEMILVNLMQETTIEGKGKLKRSNSLNQSENEKEMTWKEAYIAESFIPLTRTSMKKVKLLDRENLLAESKCHFIQMVNVTKLKWYQTGIFKVLMTVVSVGIFVFSGGLAGGVAVALYNMAIHLAMSFALGYLIKVLVDLGILPPVLTAVLAVGAVALLGSTVGVTMDFNLATTITRITEATGKVYVAETVKDNKEFKAKMEELKDKQDKLLEGDEDIHISAGIARLQVELQTMLDKIDIPLMESVEEFLARTTGMELMTEDLTYEGLKQQRLKG